MTDSPTLQRHFGLLHATALNISMIVGAGVFLTIPLMLIELPGPYALLGWIFAGVLMLADGMIWSELGAMMPGSGGSYVYLLEAFGKERWGKLMAFLFVWQFLISGPLEVGTSLIGIATFSNGLHPDVKAFNEQHSWHMTFYENAEEKIDTGMTFDPSRWFAFGLGIVIIFLLYRRITSLGKLTITVWLGVLGVLVWIVVEGVLHADLATAFDTSGVDQRWTGNRVGAFGQAMLLAMYAYLGYYNICYVGDEVKDPGQTIPRSILLSSLIVCLLFVAVHIAMLGVMPWTEIPRTEKGLETFSIAAEFMRRLHGEWGAALVSLLLIWCCFGSVFAALLGYSRIPYGAARVGHFFRIFARVHPQLRIPHVALLAVGALTLFWTFFDLGSVINALVTTRIIEQFIAQIAGVMLLRRTQPDRPRPYRIWLYPVPCFVALAGWLFLYASSGVLFITIGAATLGAGLVAYGLWFKAQ
jgi:basic amino acid/polyamine antiporter, APA family